MARDERRFALTVSGAHGANHFFKRLLPPLIPIWAVVFGFPLWKLGLLLGALTVGTAVSTAPMGILSDRYDRRHILSGGLALMALSFIAFALSPAAGVGDVEVSIGGLVWEGTFLLMLAAMLVAGLGDSVFHPAGYPLITANVDESHKGKVLGLWGASAKLGDGGAPAVMGVLLLLLAWEQILLAMGVLGLVFTGYVFYVLGEFETSPVDPRRDDRESRPTDDGPVSSRGRRPRPSADGTVDIWQADRRVYIYPMLAVFAFFAIRSIAADGVNVFIPEFITSVYGYSFSVFGISITAESTASFYYSALLIAAGVIQLGTGELVDRYDHRKVLLALLGVATVTLAALALLEFSPLALFVVLIVLGASMWGFAPARDALISDITPAEREGRTFGYLWSFAKVFGAISPVLIGYIGDVAGLRDAFFLLSVTTFLSLLPIALLLSDRFYVNVDDYSADVQAD